MRRGQIPPQSQTSASEIVHREYRWRANGHFESSECLDHVRFLRIAIIHGMSGETQVPGNLFQSGPNQCKANACMTSRQVHEILAAW